MLAQAVAGLLESHDVALQFHDLLLQPGVAVLLIAAGIVMVVAIVGAGKDFQGAAHALGAGTEEGQFADARLRAVEGVNDSDVVVDLTGGEEFLKRADACGTVEEVVRHLDEPVHLQAGDHGGALPGLAVVIADAIKGGNLRFRGPVAELIEGSGAENLVVGHFEKIPLVVHMEILAGCADRFQAKSGGRGWKLPIHRGDERRCA